MTEIREKMDREHLIGIAQGRPKRLAAGKGKLILVFLHGKPEPMAVVVENYAQNGYSP